MFPILKDSGFSCSKCGASKTRLEVHHSDVSFAEIVNLVKFERYGSTTIPLNYLSEAEFEELSVLVEDYHVNNRVKGEVLCVKCHKEVDPLRR